MLTPCDRAPFVFEEGRGDAVSTRTHAGVHSAQLSLPEPEGLVTSHQEKWILKNTTQIPEIIYCSWHVFLGTEMIYFW
jgi:hypothetical protein